MVGVPAMLPTAHQSSTRHRNLAGLHCTCRLCCPQRTSPALGTAIWQRLTPAGGLGASPVAGAGADSGLLGPADLQVPQRGALWRLRQALPGQAAYRCQRAGESLASPDAFGQALPGQAAHSFQRAGQNFASIEELRQALPGQAAYRFPRAGESLATTAAGAATLSKESHRWHAACWPCVQPSPRWGSQLQDLNVEQLSSLLKACGPIQL